MGQAGSRVLNTATKVFRDFNVENRAHRVISKEKPTPAPRYPADEKELERIAREHPEILNEQVMKNTDLDGRLKKVFVMSQDHAIKSEPSPNRPLPHNRIAPAMPEFGFEEPEVVAEGKVTLRQAIKFISDHQEDPSKWSRNNISQHYKLDAEVVENILEHFRPLNLHINKVGDKTEKIAAAPRKQLYA